MIIDSLDPRYGIIIKNTIDFYGKENQLNVCMEEPAELISAIVIHDIDNIIEELADTYICISILQEIYDIPDKYIFDSVRSFEKVDVNILADLIKMISKMRRYNEQPKEDLIHAMIDVYSLILHYFKRVLYEDSCIYEVIGKKMLRIQRRVDEAIVNNLKYIDIIKEG